MKNLFSKVLFLITLSAILIITGCTKNEQDTPEGTVKKLYEVLSKGKLQEANELVDEKIFDSDKSADFIIFKYLTNIKIEEIISEIIDDQATVEVKANYPFLEGLFNEAFEISIKRTMAGEEIDEEDFAKIFDDLAKNSDLEYVPGSLYFDLEKVNGKWIILKDSVVLDQ